MSSPHVFTVEEWHQMGTLDAFGEDARMELLDGELFDMSPIGHRHAACVMRLTRLLVRAVGDDALVSPGNPKAAAYARTGVPEYWVIDLKAEEVVVMQSPSPTGYRESARHGRGVTLRPVAALALEVPVDDVLAPQP